MITEIEYRVPAEWYVFIEYNDHSGYSDEEIADIVFFFENKNILEWKLEEIHSGWFCGKYHTELIPVICNVEEKDD